MDSLSNLQSLVRSAELGGFSAAARHLGLTPAAVSRNIAALESALKMRLFQRSTRSLTLTEAGERLLSVRDSVENLQTAMAEAGGDRSQPTGILKISMGPTFGIEYILPMLPEFSERYPMIRPEWMFENRPVNLIAEGYDAAIGGGFELSQAVVSRTLASPAYMRDRTYPVVPAGLAALDGLAMKSLRTGRITQRQMRNAEGLEQPLNLTQTLVVNDPAAMRAAALLGLGVTLIAKPDALPYLEQGKLVRLLPAWWSDAGPISIYYASRKLLPSKTRVFIDFVTEVFEREKYARRFAGSVG